MAKKHKSKESHVEDTQLNNTETPVIASEIEVVAAGVDAVAAELEVPEVQEPEVPEVPAVQEPAAKDGNEELLALLAEALEALKQATSQKPAGTLFPTNGSTAVDGIPKNHQPLQGKPGRKYKLLSHTMDMSGKIPAQQRELQQILTEYLEVGIEYSEPVVFGIVESRAYDKNEAGAYLYPQLARAIQSPSYILSYYKSLRAKNNHAGFEARGLLAIS